MGSINTRSFQRIKVGIGRPEKKSDVPTHVLAKFKIQERAALEKEILPEMLTALKARLSQRVIARQNQNDAMSETPHPKP